MIKQILYSVILLFGNSAIANAAVPLRWTVETSRATPATFEAYQGETLALEASLQSGGKPLELSGIAALYWQTNGMGSTYWEASAAVNSNRLSAVFTPEMDVGAKVYNCFIGVPGTIYHAAFQLRLRPSPGATPNVLPLPVPVIDFAKVRVLNPPWEGGGGGGVNTNAVIDIIHDTVSGSARSLPKYLHERYFEDSYPEAAEEYYAQRQGGGAVPAPQCSSVRSGGFLFRNFDYPFDDRAEFVVRMSAGKGRFASVGVAQVGTNLTEQIVTSGKPSRCYKWLPGATVDGINENGVACNINVVDGDPQTSGWNTTGDLHPLAAIRWILDNATNAQQAATYIASHIAFPSGWTQNFHYMIADESSTYIVENGTAYTVPSASSPTGALPALTNFRLYGDPKDTTGEGQERYIALTNGANITSQWWTLTYTAAGYRASDLPGITGESLTQLFNYWENNPRESHRGESFGGQPWWQTVHTSIYDLTNRVVRVAVQETDDWYTFAVPSAGGGIKEETDPTVHSWAKAEEPPVTPSSNHAGYASAADYALSAASANTAHKADSAEEAEYAYYAVDAGTAESADFASEAETANTANYANSAGSATQAQRANTAADADKAHSLHDETSGDNDISITPTFTVSDRHWIVKDTDHPNGFRLQPTDLSDYFTKSQSSTNATAKANAAIAASPIIANKADKSEIPDVSGFVPYTGAEYPVDLGNNDFSTSGNLQGHIVYADFAFGCNYTQYRDGLISCPDGNEYFLPGNVEYGKYPMFDFALRSQIKAATNGLVSAENPTFSNAVVTIARELTPKPSPTLRLFDPVLNRWVILKSVNMNITLEVE